MNFILQAVNRHTSKSGMGFAGAAGLVASGLTDIASSLGPFLPWFCFVVAAAVLALAILIRKNELRSAGEGEGSPRQRAYCQTFVVAVSTAARRQW